MGMRHTFLLCACAGLVGGVVGGVGAARVSAQSLSDGPAEPRSTPRVTAASFSWDNRPVVTLGEHVRLELRGRIQADSSRSEVDDRSDRDVELRRVGIDGRIGRALAFQIEGELGGQSGWRDAYVDYRSFDRVRVRAGQFKVPFSLDENTGASRRPFVSRSMAASALAPGRDRGVMVHGRLVGRLLAYEAGVFAHDGDGTGPARPEVGESRSGPTAAFRLSTAPKGTGLYAAAAWTTSHVSEGLWAIRGRGALDSAFVAAPLWVQGTRRRVGTEVRWAKGPATLQAEYMRLSQERVGQGVADATLGATTATGWYVSGTWAVMGPAKSKRRRDNPSVFAGGTGTVEVAARLEALTVGQLSGDGASTNPRADIVLGNRARALTLGVNWHLSRHVRILANATRDALHDPTRGPLPGQAAFWSSVLRFQVGL
jgi:phosphate-selective porin OprO/OprP